MIKGNLVTLNIDGDAVAAATSAQVQLTQQAVEYVPLVDDDGWRHYRQGALGWGVSADAYYCSDHAGVVMGMAAEGGPASVQIDVQMPGCQLAGTGRISEVSIVGETGTAARFTARLACDYFPTINLNEE